MLTGRPESLGPILEAGCHGLAGSLRHDLGQVTRALETMRGGLGLISEAPPGPDFIFY